MTHTPAILNRWEDIPYDVSPEKPLPGMGPLAADGWIIRDSAFSAQMAERDRLIRISPDCVFADAGASDLAKAEVLDAVLAVIKTRQGYVIEGGNVTRPDGVQVALHGDPMRVAARLVQEDLCLHEKRGDEHVLTAGVMCFPASWTLAEKVGRPLTGVHGPVDEYDANVAKRVQRLFDGIQVGRPLWRFNVLQYVRPDLFQPRSETDARSTDQNYGQGAYTRSEHQALIRLPKTGAVLFAIHTFVVETDS